MQIIECIIFKHQYTRIRLLIDDISIIPYFYPAMENTNSMLDKSKELPMYAKFADCGGLYIGADWTHGYAPLGFERSALYA
jgi:hypothetical protein